MNLKQKIKGTSMTSSNQRCMGSAVSASAVLFPFLLVVCKRFL